MKRILVCLVALASAVLSAHAEGWKVRLVQLDLARQMETVPFVKRYLAFAKESGYNTVQLYLEGRVRTESFGFRPSEECYSADQMREIVSEAERLGLDLVPVVSVLGHAEHFVNCPELDALCEESRAGRTRFAGRNLKQTFCHAVPGTRDFLERYLSELMEIFPGRNFHVGLDESFNTGFCPDCAAKMRDPKVGLGGLYLDVIRWAHGFLAKKGRRLWMWGDFFEFFPERVAELPRDIVICDWEYSSDISRNRGHWGTFGDRFRKDWIRTFSSLGIETVACPAGGRKPMACFSDYAENAGAAGGAFLQWEMATVFYGRRLIRARATGLRWRRGLDALDPDAAMEAAVAELCPSLDAAARQAVRSLVEGEKGIARELAIGILRGRVAAEVPEDPFSEQAILDDVVTESSVLSLGDRLEEVETSVRGLYRRPGTLSAVQTRAPGLREEAERLRARRLAQEARWRPGCRPNGLSAPVDALIARIDGFSAPTVGPAAEDEWQLELVLVLPDYHGIPGWTIHGGFEGEWRELARGSWKPRPDEWCYFERTAAFRSPRPPEALRVEYAGYNDAGLAFISVANRREGRFVPAKVTVCGGRVRDAERLLTETVDAAYFGNPDCRAQMLDPRLAEEVSTAVIELRPED